MPGTHHIRFVVDGSVVCAEDLPTAVDDNGSLANYVAVPISGQTPPSASLHPETRSPENLSAAFAAASDDDGGGDGAIALSLVVPTPQQPSTHVPLPISSHSTTGTGTGTGTLSSFLSPSPSPPIEQWTTTPPWQIACAAEEEEIWLAHAHANASSHHSSHRQQQDVLNASPPAHPQAPKLPRHLEKLILNARPPIGTTGGGPQQQQQQQMLRLSHSNLVAAARFNAAVAASTSASSASANARKSANANANVNAPIARSIGSTLPITTASGTNIAASPLVMTSTSTTTPSSSSTTITTPRPSTHVTIPSTSPSHSPSTLLKLSSQNLPDDGSVLPVPSHVVLQHLGTSAIKNGVLAVSSTNRYRKKVRCAVNMNSQFMF